MTGPRLRETIVDAESKLALTMWTMELVKEISPMMVTVNPKSLLGSKMGKTAFGMDGHDISIGADILCRAALSEEFADASGMYYDNDAEAFGDPHPGAYDEDKCQALMRKLDEIIA
ncbi:hypothetical protein U0355_08880 [Salimicrobium sp. PL1-032A]|uniref:hypothetical protein n=1 Tax=Salimicrobium sp. PL1-032A TaxID=3095364 RepID=UPI003261A25B